MFFGDDTCGSTPFADRPFGRPLLIAVKAALAAGGIRASTSPQARQLITQAALKYPLFAAAQRAAEVDHAKHKSWKISNRSKTRSAGPCQNKTHVLGSAGE
jgi:hypothetical protein